MLLQIVAGVIFVLLVLAAVFWMLDVLLDRQDKDRLKNRILDFWINTSNLEFVDQLQRALTARYARMRSLRYQFVKLFWFFCAVVALFATFAVLAADKASMRLAYKELSQTNFKYRYLIHCAYLQSTKKEEERATFFVDCR